MADVKIRVIGEDQASGVLKGIDSEMGGFANSFTELTSKISLVSGALRTVGQAAEQAFQWGKEGAAVKQTTESFNTFLNTVGAAPDLLAQLQEASKGTVDDITLMGAAMNTAAGANSDLAKQLLDVSPRLLEIAKAANKMNPTFGDTTFMFESLTAGIKRQSPLLIDNTGLKIKLGEANETLAKKLGKTVEELTAAEQSQALLNATLEAGDQLIRQVGGSTESATDGYAQLEVAIKNASDQLKQDLEPAVRAVANALNDLITGYEKLTKGVQGEIDAIDTSGMKWDQYAAKAKEIIEAQKGFYVSTENGVIKVMKREGQLAHDVTADFNLMTKAVLETGQQMMQYGKTSDGQRVAIEGVAGANAQLNVSAAEAAASVAALAEIQEKSKEEAEKQAEAIAKLVASMNRSALDAGLSGAMTKSFDDYSAKITDLKAKNAELIGDLQRLAAEGADPAGKEFADLTQRLKENTEEQARLQESTNKATREMLYQKAAAFMNEDAALKLAEAMGILSNEDYSSIRRVVYLTGALDQNGNQLVEGTELTQAYLDAMKEMGDQLAVTGEGFEDLTGKVGDYAAQALAAAAETKRLANVQEALEAGLSGRLQGAMDTYRQTVFDAAIANNQLNTEFWELVNSGTASEEQLKSLGAQIDENNRKQIEALDAMKKTTAEMIYQQASQGLSSDAALVLARGLGLVSEADYNLIVQLQALKAQFDANHDGMITAAEGADAYTAAVLRLYNAQVQLMSVLPGGAAVGGAGYVGNGIYTGGPGETIGPGAMPGAATGMSGGVYTAQAGQWAVPVTYNNYGVTMSDATALQQTLTPIINNILAGR